MPAGFYMFISDQDSKATFVDNKFSQFVVQLPSYINLPVSSNFCWQREWYLALVDITLTVGKQRLDAIPTACAVLCDLVNPSYIRGGSAELLRILPADTDITASLGQSYYMPLKNSCHSFNRLQISIRSSDLTELPETWPTNAKVTCTLHFVQE